MLFSVQKDRSSYRKVSRASTRISYGSNPKEEKESGFKQRTLDTQEPNT